MQESSIPFDPKVVALVDNGHYAMPANDGQRYDFYEWRREFLPHIIDITDHSQIREWCSDNVTGVYSFSISKVFFQLEDDALLFKLGFSKRS